MDCVKNVGVMIVFKWIVKMVNECFDMSVVTIWTGECMYSAPVQWKCDKYECSLLSVVGNW